jgi:membrane-bound lytic murein transglycosylase MltF
MAKCPVPKAFRTAFARAAAKTGVPLSLLVATAYEESRMNAGARSAAGPRGFCR